MWRIPMLSAFGKRLCSGVIATLEPLSLSGTQKMVLNRKRLRQAHVFTLLLRISIPSNWESSDVALVLR